MSISRPYRRTYRPQIFGVEGGDYFLHPKFAESPRHFICAFLLIQKDLIQLFDYIEPSDINREYYSFRINELLFRSCVEIEANCKAILIENGYTKSGIWNMNDYKKIEISHRLSSYSVKLPVWNGNGSVRQPFSAWSENGKLKWYEAYNDTKHDRYATFRKASFENMIDAVSGLLIILSAQFWIEDYTPRPAWFFLQESDDGMEPAIGDYFRVKFPDDWPEEECYDFDWQDLENEEDPFEQITFHNSEK